MTIKGFFTSLKDITNSAIEHVTVSQAPGDKVALDVNIVAGASGGVSDATAANQTLQITEATSTNTKLDTLIANQSTSTSDTTEAKQDAIIAKLEEMRIIVSNLRDEPKHDSKVITYVTSGNGLGEVETIVYSLAATTVLTRTFSYNIDNKVSSVVDS